MSCTSIEGVNAMREPEYEDMTTFQRYQYLAGQEIEPMVAATLVLADAIKDASWRLNVTDSDGHLNVNITGDIETAQRGS
jgi:hypothetical protein